MATDSTETSHDEESSASPEAEALVERAGAMLEEGRLPLKIFNDPDIHQLELDRYFGHAWVFIGHESEIPDEGDYARRYVGSDPFIFVRDRTGEIQVLFDSCRHRGTQLCRADEGNTSHFRCPYHGWTYKTDGDLIGVPDSHTAYQDMDKDEWGLLSAPRIDSYAGLVFASMDEDAPPLEEYLGDFTWYLDMSLKLTEGGMEVIGEPERHTIDQNWKIGVENSAGDGYHTQVTHKSAIEAGFMDEDWSWEGSRYYVHVHDVPSGDDRIDGYTMLMGQLEHDDDTAFWSYPPEVKSHFTDDRLDEGQWTVASQSTFQITTIPPNLTVMHHTTRQGPDKPQRGWLYLRKWRPVGPEKTENWEWFMVPEEAPDAYREEAYKAGMATFGPSGSFEQDDTSVWQGISDAAGTNMAAREEAKLNYEMGMEDGEDTEPIEGWPGPGYATRDINEGYARNFHTTWYNFMHNE